MSDNPFDVFAADLKAAVPQKEEQAAEPAPINIMAEPVPAPVPVMNQPVMNAPQPAPTMGMPPAPTGYGMNGMANPMGGPMGGGPMTMGQQPPQPQYGAPAMGAPMGMGSPMPMGAPMGMGSPMPPGQPPAMGQHLMMGQPNAMVPSANPSNPYAMPPGAPGAPFMGAPQMAPPPFGAPPAPMQPAVPAPPVPAPFDAAPPAPYDLSQQVPVPTPAPFDTAPPAPYDPSSSFGPVPTMTSAPVPLAYDPSDPFGAPPPHHVPPPQPAAMVPVANLSDDPFGVFNSSPAPPQAPQLHTSPTVETNPNDALSTATPVNPHMLTQEQIVSAADGGDPWAEMGFGPAPTDPVPSPAKPTSLVENGPVPISNGLPTDNTNATKGGDLPPGGEWYDARIFTPTLGVMFFKPQELTDSLFLQTDRPLVDSLLDRPVVAFIVEGSSARAAGVELGHVLLKVNGIDVKNPKEASRLIKEGPRPLPLLFYVPDTTVVVAEGEHMVKYDTRETGAPNSAKDWKPKYVVIGGIIAQPWMMNMYRSKSEYDIAVIETQARRPVSVKVKQFSLQGARIQNDWQGPQMVKYKNKLHPWKYIVVLPVSRNPIKISSPNLAQLKPVHEGIRRVLMAQQRHQHGGRPSGGGGGDPYSRAPQQQQQYGGRGGPPQQQQQQYGGQPQQQRGGGYGGPPQQQQQYGGQEQGRGQDYGGASGYTTAGGEGSARRRSAY